MKSDFKPSLVQYEHSHQLKKMRTQKIISSTLFFGACLSSFVIVKHSCIFIYEKLHTTPAKQNYAVNIPTNETTETQVNLIKLTSENSKPTTVVENFKLAKPIEINVPTVKPYSKPIVDTLQVIADAKPKLSPGWRHLKIKTGDNLSTLFQQAGLNEAQFSEFLMVPENTEHLKKIYPGQTIKLLISENGTLDCYQQHINNEQQLVISRNDNGKLTGKIENLPIEVRSAFGLGTIQDSLFLSGKKANLDDKLIMKLAEIFEYDIDFALDIRPNDSFKVLYEEKYIDDEKIGTGNILAAEFVNQGKTYKAVQYADDDGKVKYYTPDGKSLHKAFIRTPVNYTRISSHFNLKRKHPVLHKIRAHKGVDYAAPRGTPVKASGDGKVIFAGKQGGYGNTVIIQHGPKYSTLYAHLSRFAPSITRGTKVKQGQIIAHVGSSGLATGPHLHYEFRVNGQHQNPLTVALPKAESLPKSKLEEFTHYADKMLAQIDHHEKIMLAKLDEKKIR